MNRTTLLTLCCALLVAAAPANASAQSVMLRFQVIEADGFTETDAAINDVRSVLQELFRFRGYRLAAEAVIRVSGGGFGQDVAGRDAVYRIGAEHVFSADQDGVTDPSQVHIRGLELWITPNDRVLETSLTVPIGQTVVVGSARPTGDGPVLILVVRTEPG